MAGERSHLCGTGFSWPGHVVILLVLTCHVLTGCDGADVTKTKRVSNSNKNSNYVVDSAIKEAKQECFAAIDRGLLGKACQESSIARENCALQCGAPSCYEEVYGGDALEEGEIDHHRSRKYRVCARKLQRQATS